VSPARAAGSRVRVGSAPELPSTARLARPVPGGEALHLTVALSSQDPGGLAAEVRAVSTPGSPLYRRYLSVTEFARRFGAGERRLDAVRGNLAAHGLTVGVPEPNGLSVPVSGPAGDVQRAFATSLAQVKLAGGRAARVNTSAPTMPAAIAPDVEAVLGLSTLAAVRPAGLATPRASRTRAAAAPARSRQSRPQVVTGGPQPCAAATTAGGTAPGGYTTDEVADAYGFSGLYAGGDFGQGQSVALYESIPYDPQDIAAFQSCYGTGATVQELPVDGGPGPYVPGSTDDTEPALDIEQVIGLAPHARVLVYGGPNTGQGEYDTDSAMISGDAAKTVSISYGACEAIDGVSYIKAEAQLWQEAAVQGQSVLAAAGDTGSAECYREDPSNGAVNQLDPSTQPDVTSVGGTLIYTSSSSSSSAVWTPGAPLDEAVWNDGNTGTYTAGPGATGGGISAVWPMPSYQTDALGSLGVINGVSSGMPCNAPAQRVAYCREVPDVSALADPAHGYVVYLNGQRATARSGWTTEGGTSAATPLWAAIMALTDALPSCRGLTVGLANPELYGLASLNYTQYFRDVVLASPLTGAANNDALGSTGGLYPVTGGYDMATGLGVPNAAQLAAGMCALRAPVYRVTFSPIATQVSPLRRRLTLKLHAVDSDGVPLTYAATGLPPGLGINQSTGVISGTPSRLGTSAVNVYAGDGDANSSSVGFSWAILRAGRPKSSGVALTGAGHGHARLRFTIHAGLLAPPLKAVAVTLPRGLRFTSGRSLVRGLLVEVGKRRVRHGATLRRGVLTVTLRHAAASVFVSVGGPALRTSSTLASQVRRRRTTWVRIGLRAIDSERHLTRYGVWLRLRR
jgi:Pro-kumamolisin, activation domain/Putative Ig domain/Subtilase family